MIAVGMMQAPIDQVIRVIAVRHGFMPAARTVDMLAVVPARCRLAAVRVGGVHRQGVLVVMSFMRVMQMAVMEEIDMPVVFDGGVAAAGAVLVLVIRVGMMFV
jgi:hypothetical protein